MQRHRLPRAHHCVGAPQLVSLQAFADTLDAKMLVAVNVDESEAELEGPYWLALLNGAAFVLDEDMWLHVVWRAAIPRGLDCCARSMVCTAAAQRAWL